MQLWRWQSWFLILLLTIGLVHLIITLRTPLPQGSVIITATLDNEPKLSGQRQIFKIDRLYVITKRYPELHYGYRLQVKGQIDKQTINYPEITILTNSQPHNPVMKLVFNLRQKAFTLYSEKLPEPQASLLAGTILGIDRIPAGFVTNLRNSGLVHLVVVSGQNITLLAGFTMLSAGLVSRKLAITLTLITIGCYSLLAGAEPPVIRAALMGSLAYLGQFFGRQTLSLLMLFWSGLIMFLLEPYLIFNLSFILSFSATLGILVFGPYLRLLARQPKFISEALSTTISAWIVTLPILVLSFGQASIVSVFSNLLASVVILPIMVLGFLMLVLGLLIPALGQLIGYLVYFPLTYLVLVANLFASLPFATVSFDRAVFSLSIVYYLVLIGVFAWLRRNFSGRIRS